MEIRQCMLVENTCYQRNLEGADSQYTLFQRRGPLGVMLHSTGANNPTLRRYLGPDDGVIGKNAYGNHWNRPEVTACVHAFIGLDKAGNVRTYQTLPWNYRGWHCAASGNDTHVSIEICEDDLSDEGYCTQCFHQAAGLTAELCRRYGLDPLAEGVVLDHAEGHRAGIASNHSDVGHWLKKFGKTMDGFRQEVARLLAETKTPGTGGEETPAGDKEAPSGGDEVTPPVGGGELPDGETDHLLALIDSRIEQNRKVALTLEEVPGWARESVRTLVEQGVVQGTGENLSLSEDLVRMLVILDRLGLTGGIKVADDHSPGD